MEINILRTYHPSIKNRTSIPDHQTTRLRSTPYKVNPSNHQLRYLNYLMYITTSMYLTN